MTLKFRWETEFRETEIGEIPKDWDVEPLRWAVRSLEAGNRPKGGSLKHDPNGVLSIGGENITWQGYLILNQCLRFSVDFYKNLGKGKIEEKDILLVKDGATIGKLAFIKEIPERKAMVNEHVFLIKTNHGKYNPRTLFYYLFSEAGQIQIESAITGTAQEGITRNILDVIQIPKIELEETSCIATVLSWFDDLIENKQMQNEILEKIATALFKSWFIDFEPFKNDELIDSGTWLGKIPKGWQTKPIDKLAKIRNGISYSGKEKFEEQVEGSYLFITINNIIVGGGFKPVYSWIKSNRIKEHHFLKEGDLVITNIHFGVGGLETERLLAAPAIVTFPTSYDKRYAVFSLDITLISPFDSNYTLFLYLFLKMTKEDSVSFATGTGVLHLDLHNFKRNKMVICPPDPVLQKFVGIIEPLFQKITINQKQMLVLGRIRDILLPLLVFGKLRVEEI